MLACLALVFNLFSMLGFLLHLKLETGTTRTPPFLRPTKLTYIYIYICTYSCCFFSFVYFVSVLFVLISLYINICIYIYICIYIHTNIYVEREKEREREREREREGETEIDSYISI